MSFLNFKFYPFLFEFICAGSARGGNKFYQIMWDFIKLEFE